MKNHDTPYTLAAVSTLHALISSSSPPATPSSPANTTLRFSLPRRRKETRHPPHSSPASLTPSNPATPLSAANTAPQIPVSRHTLLNPTRLSVLACVLTSFPRSDSCAEELQRYSVWSCARWRASDRARTTRAPSLDTQALRSSDSVSEVRAGAQDRKRGSAFSHPGSRWWAWWGVCAVTTERERCCRVARGARRRWRAERGSWSAG